MIFVPTNEYMRELSLEEQVQKAVFDNRGAFELPDDWIALAVDNVPGAAIFEPHEDRTLVGHYLFPAQGAARGSRKIIDFLFDKTSCRVIEGITPRDNRAARHLSRYLGFSPIGETTDCFDRPCVVYRMTKERWAGL